MSKLLIEAVHGYGYSGYETAAKDEVLYCGMNMVLNIPNCNIHLRGPTSTSRSIIIAQNFSNHNAHGVILELTGEYETRFNVSWLSRYSEEEERIFVHGEDPMQLVSVRLELDEGWFNYKPFCKVFCQIDQACNGGKLFDWSETDQDVLILNGLISIDVS